MSTSPQDPLPPELEDIGRLMRAERRQPNAIELDELKRRVRRQAEGRSSFTPLVRKGSLLTSRLLITMLIAFGIVISGSGATLAITPSTVDTGSTSSFAQYGSDDDDDGDVEDTPPVDSPQEPPIGVLPSGPKSGSAPEAAESPRTQVAVDRGATPRLQPVRQQAEEAKELPFTGLAAIPILVAGIGLLGSGLVLRRRA